MGDGVQGVSEWVALADLGFSDIFYEESFWAW